MLRNSLCYAPLLSALALLGACSGDLPQETTEGVGAGGAGSEADDSNGPSGSTIPTGPASGPGPGTTLSPGSSMAPGPGGMTGPGSNPPSGTGTGSPTSSSSNPGNPGNPMSGMGGSGPGPSDTSPGPGPSDTPGPGPVGEGGAPPDVPGTGGTPGEGGAPGAAGMGPDLDENGKPNAKPGDMTSTPQDYLRLGEIRILNNNWGSEDLGCNAPMSVFVNQDRSFGWTFNRGDCDTANANQNPDFPQVEFGIHPFGIGNSLVTSPEFSSTTLLPKQIKDIQSSSVNVQNLTANLQREASWNITFEFWLSERDPVNDPNPGVYAEIMTFWGWQGGRWPSAPGADGAQDGGSGTGAQVSSGGKSYTLWVQRDNWASGWRYFQFRDDSGPQRSFNGTVDVKPLLDYLVNQRGYSQDLWVTRLEVGSEIDDDTQGTVQMSGISFEVNGETREVMFGE